MQLNDESLGNDDGALGKLRKRVRNLTGKVEIKYKNISRFAYSGSDGVDIPGYIWKVYDILESNQNIEIINEDPYTTEN